MIRPASISPVIVGLVLLGKKTILSRSQVVVLHCAWFVFQICLQNCVLSAGLWERFRNNGSMVASLRGGNFGLLLF